MTRGERFRARIVDTFRQAVTVTPKAGENAYGEPVAGTPATVAARIEPNTRLMQSGEGRDIVVAARLFVEWDVAITVDSAVEHDGRQYVVISGGEQVALDGTVTHSEWLLGDG